jgi:hypothetical protein
LQEYEPSTAKSQNHKAGVDAYQQRRRIRSGLSTYRRFHNLQVSLRRHGANLSGAFNVRPRVNVPRGTIRPVRFSAQHPLVAANSALRHGRLLSETPGPWQAKQSANRGAQIIIYTFEMTDKKVAASPWGKEVHELIALKNFSH